MHQLTKFGRIHHGCNKISANLQTINPSSLIKFNINNKNKLHFYNRCVIVNYILLKEVIQMAGFIIFLVIVVIVGIGVGLNILYTKLVSNNIYRAKQQVLGNVGLGAADINKTLNETQGRKATEKFLAANPSYTVESLNARLKDVADALIAGEQRAEFSDKAIAKMNSNRLLPTLRDKQFVRVTPMGYYPPRLSSTVVYADQRDEYQFMLHHSVEGDEFTLTKFDIVKGMPKGF